MKSHTRRMGQHLGNLRTHQFGTSFGKMKVAAALLCAFALVGASTATVYMREPFDGAHIGGHAQRSNQ